MATNNLNQIAANLEQLSRDELEKLFLVIEKILCSAPTGRKKLAKAPQENTFTISLVCPYCSSTHVIRFGFSNKRQRYRCKDCKRTFGDYTLYRRFSEAGSILGGSLLPGAY